MKNYPVGNELNTTGEGSVSSFFPNNNPEPRPIYSIIKLDRSERLCDKCSAGSVEDEQHFLIECSKFNEYRNNLFQTVNCNNKNFSKLDNFQKFFWLLTNEDSNILHKMGLYLHEHLE